MNKKRKYIYDKSGGLCWYCGDSLKDKRWHADHFEPVFRDNKGKMEFPDRDNLENLVPSCASCNIMKHSMSLESFRQTIKWFMVSLNRDINQYKFAKRYGLIKEEEVEVKFWFEENIKKEV